MLALIAPTPRLHSSWLAAHAEWGPGLHEDGFGLLPSDEVVSPAGFSAWTTRLLSDSDCHPVGCRYRWIVDQDEVLGGIALRYGDSECISRVGHIGFGVRPSARGRGLATWALGQILEEARLLGLDRVLLVCEADNEASAATISRGGGIFEGGGETAFGHVRRYWIEIGS